MFEVLVVGFDLICFDGRFLLGYLWTFCSSAKTAVGYCGLGVSAMVGMVSSHLGSQCVIGPSM
jgi:hypothetical protein